MGTLRTLPTCEIFAAAPRTMTRREYHYHRRQLHRLGMRAPTASFGPGWVAFDREKTK